MSDTQESPRLEDLTPEEANRIIHSHRKVRYGKWTSSSSGLPCPAKPRSQVRIHPISGWPLLLIIECRHRMLAV